MSLPTLDLSTIIFLFYLLAFLLGSRGLSTHLRDRSHVLDRTAGTTSLVEDPEPGSGNIA